MLRQKHFKLLLITFILLLIIIPLIISTKRGTAKNPNNTYTKPYHKEPNVNLTLTRDELLDKKYSQANFLLNTDAKNTIVKNAVESGSLFLDDNCIIEPVVIKTKKPLTLQLINESKSQQQILMNGKTYQIKPSQSLFLSEPMTTASEITKINCGPSSSVAAYLVFTQ